MFVFKDREIGDRKIDNIQKGDVIFAQRIKSKEGAVIRRKKSEYDTEDDWIIALHTAIYFEKDTIWHATAIAGGTCYWDIETFLEYYKIVAVKRFL